MRAPACVHASQTTGKLQALGCQAPLLLRVFTPALVPLQVRPEHVEAFFRPLPPESELQLPLLPRQAQQSRL